MKHYNYENFADANFQNSFQNNFRKLLPPLLKMLNKKLEYFLCTFKALRREMQMGSYPLLMLLARLLSHLMPK